MALDQPSTLRGLSLLFNLGSHLYSKGFSSSYPVLKKDFKFQFDLGRGPAIADIATPLNISKAVLILKLRLWY